jgi:DNA-directed RNA polymerase subunit RPC12/RpoP
MPVPEYECRKCNRVFSIEEYEKSVFCPDCGMHLWPKFVKDKTGTQRTPKGKKATDIEPIDPSPEVNLAIIFAEFNRLTDFDCGEGEIIENVPLWVTDRRRAYDDFRDRLSRNKLVSLEKLSEDFRQFLYFENNHSWTKLHRTGLAALSNPERLWKLLIHIQDESVPIQHRIENALEGQYHIYGIGKNIITGLLHMFNPDEYGVWNSRTDGTLNLIRRKPLQKVGVGNKYLAINRELKKLATELETDLTTIDGLMWYVSKRLKSQILY